MLNILIFGASGSIGEDLLIKFKNLGHNVIGTTHNPNNKNLLFISGELTELSNINTAFDAVIWAHGHNYNDSIYTFDSASFSNIIDINVCYILRTLNNLLMNNRVNPGSKMVIVSSIFEETTRPTKLSYTISKTALSGLVKNIAYDVSEKGILVNNVMLGVVNNEMTQKTLNSENINYIKNYTNFKRLINLDDVYNTIKFLIIENTAITGQSIKVDLGFTNIVKYE